LNSSTFFGVTICAGPSTISRSAPISCSPSRAQALQRRGLQSRRQRVGVVAGARDDVDLPGDQLVDELDLRLGGGLRGRLLDDPATDFAAASSAPVLAIWRYGSVSSFGRTPTVTGPWAHSAPWASVAGGSASCRRCSACCCELPASILLESKRWRKTSISRAPCHAEADQGPPDALGSSLVIVEAIT
jgi:hypothetical protein